MEPEAWVRRPRHPRIRRISGEPYSNPLQEEVRDPKAKQESTPVTQGSVLVAREATLVAQEPILVAQGSMFVPQESIVPDLGIICKFETFFFHQVGRMKVSRALDW